MVEKSEQIHMKGYYIWPWETIMEFYAVCRKWPLKISLWRAVRGTSFLLPFGSNIGYSCMSGMENQAMFYMFSLHHRSIYLWTGDGL